MIASLHGTVAAIQPDGAVIECGGVGYFVVATPQTLGSLIRGEEATVLTTLVVREDALTLYGFHTSTQREMFALLQTVTGMGPRLALATLAALEPGEIATAVRDNDVKTLQRVSGVGKRMAERMSLELKEKVGGFVDSTSDNPGGSTVPSAPGGRTAAQLTEALVSLGFTDTQATDAIAHTLDADEPAPVGQALKRALAWLGRKD